jgi:PAS domain S-box-containing protein
LYENSLDGILLTRPDGTVISANTQACNLHGMTEDEIIQSGREGLVVNNKKLAVALKERELTGRMRAELTCKRKDGSTFACDVTSNLFTDSDGSIMTSMIVRDITERKQTEKKLQENERKQQELIRSIEMERAQLEAVLDNLPVGVWIAGQNGHLIGKNKEADRIWAGDAPLLEDVEKYPQYTAWYADSGKLLMAEEYPVAKALLTGQPVEPIELRIRRFDNTVGTVLVSAAPIKDKQGRLTGAVGINVDITERKKAEDLLYQAYEKIKFQSTELHAQTEKLHRAYEALSESEKKYRIIVETANEGIWTVNPEARTTYVNKKMAEMLGYAQDEMVGRPVWEFAYEESKAVIKRNLENREQGIDESYEFKLRRKDGSPLWTFVSGKSLFDSNGKFTGTMGMFTDISQRKGAETKLRETLDNLENLVKERTADLENAYNSLKESEKDLAEAQEMAHIGNWNWNIVTNELHWSDEVYRIFGLKPQEFKATFDEYFKYVHPEDRDHLNNAIKKTFEGEPYSVDNKIITANGEERIVHTDAEIIFNEDNIPVYARGIVQDITERKRAEEALRRSEERFRVALKGSRVVMFSQDLDLRYTWVYNPSPGFKSEDVLDKRDYDIYQPEDAETFVAIKRQVLASGVGRRDEVVTHRPISAGGNLVHEMTTEPLLDSTGAIVGIICVAVDITERKKAEEIMAKIEIARKQEIHHRIKNNLQVISSLLDLQADKFNNKECIKDSEVLEAFKESQNRVISMALIHEELYKGGEFETLNFSPYIKELAENLLQTYNLGDTDISLKLNLAQNVFFDMDTAVPLGIIVNELITNSFKHAFSGRKEGEIQIGLHREENVKLTKSTNEDCKSESFALIISDNGVGIPESLDIEDLDTLGMQLVVSLVDQLDGELETERDNGTKFIIRFTVIERNNQASALPAPIN